MSRRRLHHFTNTGLLDSLTNVSSASSSPSVFVSILKQFGYIDEFERKKALPRCMRRTRASIRWVRKLAKNAALHVAIK